MTYICFKVVPTAIIANALRAAKLPPRCTALEGWGDELWVNSKGRDNNAVKMDKGKTCS